MIFTKTRERRLKALIVSPDVVLNIIFTAAVDSYGRTRVMPGGDVPEGCEVHSVNVGEMDGQIVFLLYHPSFPVVDEVQSIPQVKWELCDGRGSSVPLPTPPKDTRILPQGGSSTAPPVPPSPMRYTKAGRVEDGKP